MEKKKITIVTSEIHEVLVVRRTAEPQYRRWCPLCGLEVDMFTPQGAATRLDMSAREIYRRLEAAEIHFSEEPGLPLLVCGNSFSADLNNRNPHVASLRKPETKSGSAIEKAVR